MHLINRCQQGFTTVTVMGTLMVGGLLVAAGFAAVDPDIALTRDDEDAKQAYAAAEAGLNYYLHHLGQDNSYYLKCTNVPPPGASEPSPVNQQWNGSGADPRVFRAIPGYQARYAIELLPAPGYSQCLEGQQVSMVDPSTGAFRLRATGVSGDEKRSIIATLRRKSFLDFLYLTDFETGDPATYVDPTPAWASANCVTYRAQRHSNCTDISFISIDNVRGPLHTNDDLLVCGTPTLGRTASDAIEVNGASPGWISGCGGSSPNFLGTRTWPGGNLPMPPSNTELFTIAEPAYRFIGRTDIVLQGNSMVVTRHMVGTTQTVPLPPNGVIYVSSAGCASGGYARTQLYTAAATCGNVEVRGTYNKDLTIAADNDVIIEEDLMRGGSGRLLGLIANNFVRVYHPVTNHDGSDCDNNGGPGSLTIQAAILAIKHSFIVDNWYCGNSLGTLTLEGAIAQSFRGPVGRHSGGTVVHGYGKDYVYDDRLRFREPPYFLDPVQSAWQIARQNEQIPPR